MRQLTTINQNWQFAKKKNFQDAQVVTLPHSWNAIDGQDGHNDYFRGTCWYRKALKIDQPDPTHEYWLQFDAVAQRATVYVNGQQVAHHDGGYSIFRANITDALKAGDNQILVQADNLPNDQVYPQKADFTFYGGITRDVHLIEVNHQHIALGDDGSQGIKITPHLADDQTEKADVEVQVWTENTPDATPVTVQVGSQLVTGTVVDNQADLHLTIDHVHRWDGVNDPYLYLAQVTLGNDLDYQQVHFGCRTYRVDPQRGFILNGHPYRLLGAAKHEDYWHEGSAVTRDHAREDFQLLMEMGGNAFRLAHYQHLDYEYQLADQLGIIVWAEMPMITKYMQTGDANAEQQYRELIKQNWNHASIICWTMSKEITVTTGVTKELLACHRRLNDLAHHLDDSRLTAIANAFMLETDSPLLKIPDMITYNIYYGWYVAGMDGNEQFLDQFHHDHPDMAIGLSEYGADNNPAFHAKKPVQGDYSEEYAALLHEHMLKIWQSRPWMSMMFPWTLCDFGADGREEGGKAGQNQKGLVTIDRKVKKDSYYVYKAYLSKQPFVHLCGHRYLKRPHQTQVKVYSNLPAITLEVNGRTVAKKQGGPVFEFDLKLEGDHAEIVASHGQFKDRLLLTLTDQPVPEYSNGTAGAVANWFNQNNDPNCYSLDDTVNDLKANPEAAKVLKAIMDQATAAFGEVAKHSKMPPAMAKRMNAVPLNQLLRMVSRAFTPKEVTEYNNQLQQIQKTK